MAFLEQPVNLNSPDKVADQLIANQILEQAGLQAIAAPKSEVAQVMEEMGWTLREDLESLRTLKNYAENDGIRLQAVRTSLELRKVLGNKDPDTNDNKGITFNIVGGNFQLNSILNPER